MVRPFEELLNLGGVAVEEAPIEQQQPSPDPVQRVGAKSFEEIMAEGRMQEDGERQQAQQISLSQPDYPEDKIDFFENIKRGGWGGFFDKATLGVKPLVEAASLYGATKRLRANDYGEDVSAIRARRADQEQIIDYLEDQAEVQSRGLTVAATVGTVVGEMLPFVVEFIATGGLAAIGKKAVTKSVLKLATKIAGKEAAKQAGKFTARQATAKLAGWATAAGVRTALTPHRVLKGYIDNRMPDIQFSPEGQIILKESKNSPFTAAYKAIASQWVEMASEEAGAAIGKAVGFAGKKVLPASAVAAMNRLRDAWVGAKGGRKITDFVKKISSITGKGSMLEEMGEERLGALMRIPLGIDESGKDTTFEKIGNALYPGARQLWIEAIAFSVPAGGQLAISKALGGGEKKTFSRKDVKDLFGIDKPTSAAERKQIFDDYQAVRNQELSLPPPATGAVGTEAAAPAIEQAEGIVQPTQAPSMGLAAPKEGVSPGEGAITPKPTQAKPEAVGEIGKPFSEQVEDLKVLHKKGEITTRELGARISAIKTEPITEVVKSSKLTGINKLLDDFEEGIIETAEDLVDEVDAISEDAPQLQEAVNRFRADAREDLEVFGDRGDSDAREEAFIAAIKQARPAKPEGKVVKSKGLIEKPVAEVKSKGLIEKPKVAVTEKVLSVADTAKEVDESLGRVLSVKNLSMGEVREDLGLGKVPSEQRKKQQTSVDNAIEKRIPENALRIATEVQQNPRQMTDEEEAGMLVRSVQLRDEYKGLKKQLASADEADRSMISANMDRIEAEFDIISRATKTAGTEIARALAFRRSYIDEEYDILSVKTRARAKKGRALTEKEVAKFEELTTKLDDANKKIAELQEKADEAAVSEFVQSSKRPAKRSTGQKMASISALSRRINELLEQGCV